MPGFIYSHASLHQRLRGTDDFSAIRMAADCPERIRAENEEEILQYSVKIFKRASELQPLRSMASSPWQPITPLPFSEGAGAVPDWLFPSGTVRTLVLEIEGYFSDCVLFIDEAYFTRDGVFNTHNLHMWQNDNPQATQCIRATTNTSLVLMCGQVLSIFF